MLLYPLIINCLCQHEKTMPVSLFDLFKIGIGPSSSHTVGPMLAALSFVKQLKQTGCIAKVKRCQINLYGSLALTGLGHGTDRAIILGLAGYKPDLVDPNLVFSFPKDVQKKEIIALAGKYPINFKQKTDLVFHRTKRLDHHPNGIKMTAFATDSKHLSEQIYYSTGGGFIATEAELIANSKNPPQPTANIPYPFSSGKELLELSDKKQICISDLVLANEMALRNQTEIEETLDTIWNEMNQCIDRGCQTEGVLPGKLKVKRRAGAIYRELNGRAEQSLKDPLTILDWVNLYALAVNEENAAGSRIVTAPTNGASGIIPAVIRYYERFCQQGDRKGIHKILLTATAIGSLYAKNASISGAEVGCQGEVGVACSMAAGGLTAALGGTALQVEQAAEIGMEHNLGLTCDPIGGLVQIPCIERNAMGAVKAINASRIALRGNGHHFVSLDSVIKTMKDTGKDMKTKYKETARGGLAVNVPLC